MSVSNAWLAKGNIDGFLFFFFRTKHTHKTRPDHRIIDQTKSNKLKKSIQTRKYEEKIRSWVSRERALWLR